MMPRPYYAIAFLLLAACSRPSNAAPEEVLRLSALANQNLTSASFDLEAEFDNSGGDSGFSGNGELTAMGSMQNGGRQIQMDIRGEGEMDTGTEPVAINADVSLIVAGENEVYMKVTSLSMEPPSPFLSIFGLDRDQGTWIKMPASSSGTQMTAMTPDPRMLRMQAEIVTVTKDRGIVTLDGSDVHHYDVQVDKEKLIAFLADPASGQSSTPEEIRASVEHLEMSGEMWIDTNSHVIRRVLWMINSTDESKPLNVTLTLNLRQHNEPVTIAPPKQFKEYTPALPVLPSGITLPYAP